MSLLSPSFDVVATVHDGSRAVDATLALSPDIVILDIAMPGLDGFQAAARIRDARSPARVAFLSNHVGDDFVLAAVSRGARAFVAKSRMSADLPAAIAHVDAGRQFVPSASVLPIWPRPAGRQHDIQWYDSDEAFAAAGVAFFESALQVGDSIVAIARPRRRELLELKLASRGYDLPTLLGSGRYTHMDSEEALAAVCRDGVPDPVRYAVAVDPVLERALAASPAVPPHVSMFGEIAPLLCERGEFESAIALERIADDYTAARSLSLLCAYSQACTGTREEEDGLARVCGLHSTVVPVGPAE